MSCFGFGLRAVLVWVCEVSPRSGGFRFRVGLVCVAEVFSVSFVRFVCRCVVCIFLFIFCMFGVSV